MSADMLSWKDSWIIRKREKRKEIQYDIYSGFLVEINGWWKFFPNPDGRVLLSAMEQRLIQKFKTGSCRGIEFCTRCLRLLFVCVEIECCRIWKYVED